MQTFISIRQIANGFLVSTAGVGDKYANTLRGPERDETFYPSQEAIMGAATTILSDAIDAAEKAAAEYERAVTEKRRLYGEDAERVLGGATEAQRVNA